jgi:hypothetical protein
MEAVQTSETLVNSYQSTRSYNLENSHLQGRLCPSVRWKNFVTWPVTIVLNCCVYFRTSCNKSVLVIHYTQSSRRSNNITTIDSTRWSYYYKMPSPMRTVHQIPHKHDVLLRKTLGEISQLAVRQCSVVMWTHFRTANNTHQKKKKYVRKTCPCPYTYWGNWSTLTITQCYLLLLLHSFFLPSLHIILLFGPKFLQCFSP